MTAIMVESQQTVVARMVLPLASTTTARNKERAGYQLQPAAMHVNHGLLPAAALSNFFKAPATPIRSKLPSISISNGRSVYRTKSMHQKNKCLAEVIQSQLMELKRLQDRYRCQKVESKTIKLNQRKNSIEESTPSPTKSNTSSSDPEPKKGEISKLLTPNIKLMPKRQPLKPTTLVNKDLTITQHSTDAERKVHKVTIATNTLTKLAPAPIENSKVSVESLLTTHDKDEDCHSPLRNSFMDPSKLASIADWIESVEIAQRLEGKCSEVISTPSL